MIRRVDLHVSARLLPSSGPHWRVCASEVGPTLHGVGALAPTEPTFGLVRRSDKLLTAALARLDLAAGAHSTLAPGQITPKALYEAAKQGDAMSLEVWQETGHFLGLGLGSFINLFAPDVLAIGGQVAKAAEFFLPPAIQKAKEVAIPTLFADANIAVAERVEDAGILGAAALALEAIR